MKSVRVAAKINIHLQVAGRRTDGFHELRTLFQSVGLWDSLAGETAEPGDLELAVTPAHIVPAGSDNLVLQAADALCGFVGRRCGARLWLHKRIPVAGGLGGGAAEAAAALVLLNDLWELGLQRGDLHQIAASLGSDVPFCLYGGLALGTGRGEEIWPLDDLEPVAVLLVVPSVQVSTAEIFAHIGGNPVWASMHQTVYSGLVASPLRLEWGAMVNDLQAIVCSRWPEVATALRQIEQGQCLHAAVTGSGSCVFAVFEDAESARREAGQLNDRFHVEVVSTLTRRQALLQVDDVAIAGTP